MYVLYEKATNRIERVSISDVKEPTRADVIVGLENPQLYDGFNTTDNEDVIFNKFSYEVRFNSSGEPYLYYHQPLHMECESQEWVLAHGWQRQLCEGEDTLITVKFLNDAGDPVAVSGELRADSYHLHISDSHIMLDDQEDVSFYVRGRFPCHTSIELHLYPTNYAYVRPDRGANEGRPFVRDRCRVNVASCGTYKKYSDMPYYDLVTDKVSIPADGASLANLTVVKRHANGTADTSSNETVLITTTRGLLSTESLQLVDGIGTFSLRSVEETVDADVVVKSEGGRTIRDEVTIHFHA